MSTTQLSGRTRDRSLILGIETSCDETAAAVVEDGIRTRSNIVASQIALHRRYGGVFPELASRQHVLDIGPVVQEAMTAAKADWNSLTAIAVTNGPGLVGSLLVGVNAAKSLAWAKGIPLVGINHLEAHWYANWLMPAGGHDGSQGRDWSPPQFPLVCLIVSGGHSDLVLVSGHDHYRVLGRTLDDAAGEAFDKVARLLGLGYPGGPAIQAAAENGDPTAFPLPRAWLPPTYNFSFSGLKTAVLRIIRAQNGQAPLRGQTQGSQHHPLPAMPRQLVADLAASFQDAVVDVLVEKTRRAAIEFKVSQVLLAGGVASNSLLRKRASALSLPVRYPPPSLCTDNAAMVAAAGHFRGTAMPPSTYALDVYPGMSLVTAARDDVCGTASSGDSTS